MRRLLGIIELEIAGVDAQELTPKEIARADQLTASLLVQWQLARK